ncbi:MAG: response regulator [Acidobacteria bacterium]|nr:response regulator [Acidobacteriota bacterium]MCA1652327.1 response regulator [Acidobacteriota bacterium]
MIDAARPPPHVLIVEDSADTRNVLRYLLQSEGMTVTEAVDGLDALERLHDLRARLPPAPSVILLDLMMPRCSGDEFRRKQLSDPLTADVPVIVISAVPERRYAFEDLSPFAVMPKPFDLEELLATIRRAVAV